MFKKFTRYMLSCCVVAMFSACGGHDHHDEGDEHEHEHEHEGHGHEGHDHVESEGHRDEAGLIVMEHDQLEQLGIASTAVEPGTFANIIKVSGQIVRQPGSDGAVAARQSGIVKLSSGISEGMSINAGRTVAVVNARAIQGGDQGEAARAAYNGAKRELDRLTPLHAEGIVSTKDYNAALQRVEETRAALGGNNASNSAAVAPISGVITSIDVKDGEFVEAGQTIATIGSNNALTLRADLPESKADMLSTIKGAKFRPSYSSTVTDVVENGGKVISSASVSTATNGYIPVYFSLPARGTSFIGGSYCEVYLLGDARQDVISVPEEAISEQQGKYYVYIEVEHEHFKKQPVNVGLSDGSRREITAGLKPGDKVVTKGTTYVRLAESSGVVPEGHSHNH